MWRNKEIMKSVLERNLVEGKRIVVFDTETTGLGKDAKIIQFSAMKFLVTKTSLKKKEQLDIYINPEEKLSEKIVELTGITDDILANAKTERYHVRTIADFMQNADAWAAYNAPFDIRMLEQMCDRTNYYMEPRPIIDVLEMARDMLDKTQVENHKLQTIVNYLHPDKQFQFHSAIEDVEATAYCLATLSKSYFSSEDDMKDKLQAKVEWASYCVNPRKKSEIRIKLNLSVGEYGDIYWDCKENTWKCKATKKARELFQTLNLRRLEEQVLYRYGWKYKANNMHDLASNWGKEKRKAS